MLTLNDENRIDFPAFHLQAVAPPTTNLSALHNQVVKALPDADVLAFSGPEAADWLDGRSSTFGRSVSEYVLGTSGRELLARVRRMKGANHRHRMAMIESVRSGSFLIWIDMAEHRAEVLDVATELAEAGVEDVVYFDGATMQPLDREALMAPETFDDDLRSKVQAAHALANLAAGLRMNWAQMADIRHRLEALVVDVNAIARGRLEGEDAERWTTLWARHDAATTELAAMVHEAETATDGAAAQHVWADVLTKAGEMLEARAELKELGDGAAGADQEMWGRVWDGIEANVGLMMAHARAVAFQLAAFDKLDREGRDAVASAILRHTPAQRPLHDATRYAEEYVGALQAIRDELRSDKNLWDRFLDLLAGGTHQGAAERVAMMRWVDPDGDGAAATSSRERSTP